MKLNKVNFKRPLTIIIPLHNKEENIVETLQSIFQYINAPELQIIIIENGSTDNSKIRALEVVDANKVNQDIILKNNELNKEIDKEIETTEEEIKLLKKNSINNINKIAIETSSNIIQNLINVEINRSNVSAIVEDISKKRIEKKL